MSNQYQWNLQYLDQDKHFKMKPDLLHTIDRKKIIADTKYKMVYDDSFDNKKGISQNDLFKMIAYAIRFNITDIRLFYPNSILIDTKLKLIPAFSLYINIFQKNYKLVA